MNTLIEKTVKILMSAVMVTSLAACVASTRDIDPSGDPVHYSASYDFSDKKKIVDDLTASLLSSPIAYRSEKPILVVYNVANETSEHINTGGITDDIRLALIQSQKYRFLNKKQRSNIAEEAAYQRGNVPAADQIQQGRQLGADYILSGTLRSIEKEQLRQWRLFEKKMVYYSLNLEMTDLESGEISWADKVELAREQSKPIFRW